MIDSSGVLYLSLYMLFILPVSYGFPISIIFIFSFL
nr:MAG TPA: hypothetical protein [Caudoviricetes sp.]